MSEQRTKLLGIHSDAGRLSQKYLDAADRETDVRIRSILIAVSRDFDTICARAWVADD